MSNPSNPSHPHDFRLVETKPVTRQYNARDEALEAEIQASKARIAAIKAEIEAMKEARIEAADEHRKYMEAADERMKAADERMKARQVRWDARSAAEKGMLLPDSKELIALKAQLDSSGSDEDRECWQYVRTRQSLYERDQRVLEQKRRYLIQRQLRAQATQRGSVVPVAPSPTTATQKSRLDSTESIGIFVVLMWIWHWLLGRRDLNPSSEKAAKKPLTSVRLFDAKSSEASSNTESTRAPENYSSRNHP